MFTPRKGTEAYKVEKEVEKRKKNAKDRGLDNLACYTYHETGLKHFPSWIKHSKEYVHPDIVNLKERTKKAEKADIDSYNTEIVEFDMRGKHYRTEYKKQYNFARDMLNVEGEDINAEDYSLAIFIDNKKAFQVEIEDTYNSAGLGFNEYSPGDIKAYTSDEWVKDFEDIKVFTKKAHEKSNIAIAEDPEKVRKLKKDFNIGNDLLEDNGPVQQIEENKQFAEASKKWKNYNYFILAGALVSFLVGAWQLGLLLLGILGFYWIYMAKHL